MRATLFLFFAIILVSGRSQIAFSPDSACGRFGIACGIAGSPEKSTITMISLVNNNDKTQLLNWLVSNNPQNKIHGLVGLYFIEKNGQKLSQEEKDKMKEAQNSHDIVDCCMGCAFGLKKDIVDLTTRRMLHMYYHWYLKCGWVGAFRTTKN